MDQQQYIGCYSGRLFRSCDAWCYTWHCNNHLFGYCVLDLCFSNGYSDS